MACAKQRFRTEETATRALLEIWRRFPNDPIRRERRAYYCDECSRWHLTSRPTAPAASKPQP